jgi:cell division protease FtsH
MDNSNPDHSRRNRTIGIWVLLIAGFLAVYWITSQKSGSGSQQVPASQFLDHIEKGEMTKVAVSGGKLVGELKDKKVVKSFMAEQKELFKLMREKKVTFSVEPEGNSNQMVYMLLKIVLPLIVMIWIFRKMGSKIGGQMDQHKEFTASKAIQHEETNVTFADVAGIDEAVEEVSDLVGFLRDPTKYNRLGGRVPKGVLLTGLPGTGKTLLARAVAGEAKVPFFSLSGSEFVEMFVGVGASRVRDLFAKARANAPCIVFIDEIDAVGRHRGGGIGNSHDEREQTLNQILKEMDGFEANSGIIVLAATNRPDILDKAMTRAGRFDRHVDVPMPDAGGREKIFQVHCRKLRLAEGVNFPRLAKLTPQMSGAQIEELCNEAALRASKLDKPAVDMSDFEYAADKVQLGAERRGITIREAERRLLAYHEAGHALAGHFSPDHDPVDKVTIVPRGPALGLTHFLPEDDRHLMTEQQLRSLIVCLLGGRAAERELGTATTGASNDLERATDIAKQMVMRFAMVPDLDIRTYGPGARANPWQEVERHEDYSEQTAQRLDQEIGRIVGDCWKRAQEILTGQRALLDRLASALLDQETLGPEELQDLLGPRPSFD